MLALHGIGRDIMKSLQKLDPDVAGGSASRYQRGTSRQNGFQEAETIALLETLPDSRVSALTAIAGVFARRPGHLH